MSDYLPQEGIFWWVDQKLIYKTSYASKKVIPPGEKRGFLHINSWQQMRQIHPEIKSEVGYTYYPRGRVIVQPIFNQAMKFDHFLCDIYCDACIYNDEVARNEILEKFDLNNDLCQISWYSGGSNDGTRYVCHMCKDKVTGGPDMTDSQTQVSPSGFQTGFDELDKQMANLPTESLVLIAARPSMGKTTFALEMARHLALEQKNGIAIFSLDLSKEQMMNSLISMESKVDYMHMESGSLKNDDWDKLLEASDIIGQSRLIIDDNSPISVSV